MTANDTPLVDTVPPCDPEAEMAALGAMLASPDALRIGLAELRAGDFFRPEHADLFRLIGEIGRDLQADERLDIVTVCNALHAAGLYERIGGQAYLVALVDSCPALSNIRFYAQILREKAALRCAMNAAAETLRAVSRPGAKAKDALKPLLAAQAEVVRREATQAGKPDPGAGTPVLTCMADVKAETLRWLWRGRIPLGKVTLIFGDPGLGKSLVTLDVTARVSRGLAWPDAPLEPATVGGVILLSAEDDVGDTIRPRLDAAGADVTRIVAFQGVEYGQDKRKGYFNLACDLPALEAAIRKTPDTRLVIIDPISAYLGGADSHKNSEIRGLLAPLADLAARHGAAVVGVTHLNKGMGGRALYRATGSLAFVAAARAGWLVTADSGDPKRRLFLPAKMNLAEEPLGLAYRIVPVMLDGIGPVPRLEWDSAPVTMTADEALAAEVADGNGGGALQEAAAWLQGILADGPVKAVEVKARATADGIASRTLDRAKATLTVEATRQGFGGPWVWVLPAHSAPSSPEERQA